MNIGTSYAQFHFRTARDPIVRFTEAISQARRPIVFLPESSSGASSIESVLKFLAQRFHTSKVALVARKEVVSSLPEHRGFNILTFTPEELNIVVPSPGRVASKAEKEYIRRSVRPEYSLRLAKLLSVPRISGAASHRVRQAVR